MMKLKKGREEIMYLLTKAIEKYKSETGRIIIQNTNRKNYEGLAQVLSEISNQLPNTAASLGHDNYPQDTSSIDTKYPFRKYDITGGQIKDAISGIVSNPRPFLVDACYIYLFGQGRKAFSENPTDNNLILLDTEHEHSNGAEAHASVSEATHKEHVTYSHSSDHASTSNLPLPQTHHKGKKAPAPIIAILSALVLILAACLFYTQRKWHSIKQDMNILSYQPTTSEIDSLQGIWLTYTGSPQARTSDASRFHKIVSNIVELKYKNGYFTMTRYGASFNHVGYAQFESKNIVSLYSRLKNTSDSTESPRHSLLTLDPGNKYLTSISSSWNFDIGNKNKIIGIREVFIKQGSGGNIEEVMNEIENSSCQCKVIRWHQPNNSIKTFYLRNEVLDSLHEPGINSLINESSILLKDPKDSLLILNTKPKQPSTEQ